MNLGEKTQRLTLVFLSQRLTFVVNLEDTKVNVRVPVVVNLGKIEQRFMRL